MTDNITFDQVRTGDAYNLISLYEGNDGDNIQSDSPFQYCNTNCDYFEPNQFQGIVNTWFENYLFERTQFVEFGCERSSTQNIQCGVPQGSILGPLLYLIYVNDICNSCNSNILSFADDTTVYVSDSDIHKALSECKRRN